MPINSSPSLEPSIATLCALRLGRVQIGITRASSDALSILAPRLIRESLITSLRQEGHEFTDSRFFAWYAGLETLTDGSRTTLRPPKALCQAILIEFQHSPWDALANASQRLQNAFFAPSDFNSGDDHEDAHTTIDEARRLIASLGTADDALPFQPIVTLFAAAAKTARFAREERSLDVFAGHAIEREQVGNSRWALDILAGQYLAPRHGLPIALPMPGLVTLPARSVEVLDAYSDDPPFSAEAVLSALHDALARLDHWLDEAESGSALLRSRLQDRRSSGRARDLARCLAGFGPLRGRQIEKLLGASRTGVGVIMGTLETSGLIATDSSRNATRICHFSPSDSSTSSQFHETSTFTPSTAAISEYEASMQAIDELLNRSSLGPSAG